MRILINFSATREKPDCPRSAGAVTGGSAPVLPAGANLLKTEQVSRAGQAMFLLLPHDSREHCVNRDEVVTLVRRMALDVVENEGLELFDIDFRGSTLRVVIDGPMGVTLDDCARVSNALSDHLDIADCIPWSYRLEVSSPRLDRPLRNLADFSRHLGRRARIEVKEPSGRIAVVRGRIAECVGEFITVMDTECGTINMPYGQIHRARLEVAETKKGEREKRAKVEKSKGRKVEK